MPASPAGFCKTPTQPLAKHASSPVCKRCRAPQRSRSDEYGVLHPVHSCRGTRWASVHDAMYQVKA